MKDSSFLVSTMFWKAGMPLPVVVISSVCDYDKIYDKKYLQEQ